MITNHISLPDTRQVTVTNDSVVVDGRDISNLVVSAQLTVEAGAVTVLELDMIPDAVLYSGPVVVPEVPLDGIARLRKRLSR